MTNGYIKYLQNESVSQKLIDKLNQSEDDIDEVLSLQPEKLDVESLNYD